MKISELIEGLQSIKKYKGDLLVALASDNEGNQVIPLKIPLEVETSFDILIIFPPHKAYFAGKQKR